MDKILEKIKEEWKLPIVLRKDIAKFSCGLVTTRSLQTLDSRGQGIGESVTIKTAKLLIQLIQPLSGWKAELKNRKRKKKDAITKTTFF